ncbi:MAG: RluA family pseudouridine synthase [Patescibacteria group bacterium]
MKIIFENGDLLAIDKPAGKNSDDFPKRVHRLDKDTSGILLIAKNDKTLEFLQKQFKNREIEKKYILLVVGKLKTKQGNISTLLARGGNDRKKQRVFSSLEPGAERKNLKEAITGYKVLKEFESFTLIEAKPKTGRKHQLRVQFAYLGHPIAGDKLYGFKNQACPKELKRQFLHANYLKIKLINGKTEEFYSDLPEELKIILKNIK